MIATIFGGISNILLGPIFIFVFKVSVKGAEIATIIDHILTFIINIYYLKKSKKFKVNKESIKLDKGIYAKEFFLLLNRIMLQLPLPE